ncbi:MAG: rhomboid family intramembrane serine protease [Spirosomataceae bacterium]
MRNVFDEMKGIFSNKSQAVTQIILVNVLVFAFLFFFRLLASFSDDGQASYAYMLRWLELSAPIHDFILKPWTLVSYMFVHTGVFHILFNLIALYWFGTLLQDFIGVGKFKSIYFLGGIISGVLYLSVYNLLQYNDIGQVQPRLIGSSAAIYAVMFAAATLIPDYEFFFFQRFAVKLKYLAWAALLFSFLDASSGLSHAGGALVGFGYVSLLKRGIDLAYPFHAFLRVFKRKPATRKTEKSFVSNRRINSLFNEKSPFPDQDEVDSILDKISKSGYESLSKDEKHKLYLASQRKD